MPLQRAEARVAANDSPRDETERERKGQAGAAAGRACLPFFSGLLLPSRSVTEREFFLPLYR